MNTDQLQKFKDALTKACNEHIEKGGKVIAGKFAEFGTECKCPITIYIGGQERANAMSDTIAKSLDIPFTADDLFSFIYGFDGRDTTVLKSLGKADQDLYELGKDLRTVYIKESK